MKKVTCLLTVFCLTVMLAACGGKTDSGENTQTGTGSEESAAPAETKSGSEEIADLADTAPDSEDSAEAEGQKAGNTAAEAEDTADRAATGDTEMASEAGETAAGSGETSAEAQSDGRSSLFYMGHSSIRITTPEGKVIYIDPYAGDGYEPAADLILVTHGHYDHYDLDKVANRNPDCRIITWQEALANGDYQTFDLGYAFVEAVEAGNNQYHSLDECVGYVLTLSDGISVYVSGDTSTTDQMSSLAEKEIDYAFYCCDGVYNMDLDEAAQCAELVRAKHNIPYHMVPADSGAVFDRSVAEQFDVPDLLIIEDGQEIELE